MAAPLQSVNFFAGANPDLSQQQMALAQQQAMAQKMAEEGSKPLDPTRQAGGWVIPISPMEGLAHAGKQMAAAMMQRNVNEQQSKLAQQQTQAMLQLLRGGAGPAQTANPMEPGSPQPSIMASNAPAADITAGINPQPQPSAPTRSPLSVTGDPNKDMGLIMAGQMFGPGYSALLGKQYEPSETARMIEEARAAGVTVSPSEAYSQKLTPPVNVRPGGTVYVPGKGPVYIAPNLPPGSAPTNPQNPTQGVQQIPGVGGVLQANQEAEARGKQPFGMQMMKVPVYLPGGDQTEVNLNPMQAEAYNRTGQLPPEIAASIPGYQPPHQAAPGAPQQPGVPPVNPQQPLVPRTDMSNPPMSVVPPEDRPAFNAAIPPKNFVQPPLGDPAVGRPVVGRGQTQSEQVTQARQTTAGKAVDEQFAKDYVAFTMGGAQDAQKQLSQLHDVVSGLSSPNARLTGPMTGSTPDALLKFTNPNAIAMRERVEEVVQRSLRVILGAQFTEKEGERLIARAYNPNLPERENAIRVNRLATQLQQAFEAKQSAAQYFEKNNTLQGWGGKMPTMSDFDPSGTSAKGAIARGAAPMYATNPGTKARIVSKDGGQTWEPAQ